MRFLDLCEKEVVSVEEGRFIGHVRDTSGMCVTLSLTRSVAKSVRLSCRDRENIWEYFAGIMNIVFHGLRL